MEIKATETFVLTEEEEKAWDTVEDILDTIRCRSEQGDASNDAEKALFALYDFWDNYLEG